MRPADASEQWTVRLDHPADFAAFRTAARRFVAAGVSSRDVAWVLGDAERGLFGRGRPVAELPDPEPAFAPRVPRDFVPLAETVICHRTIGRFELLHRLLERLQQQPKLLEIASDPDVAKADDMAKNVRRCSHKMKAFVRFREATDPDGSNRFVAWFEPEHHTLDMTAPFFVRRFPEMRWSILTPMRSAHWDFSELTMGDGASPDLAPDGDVNEELWRTYFASIFNPARLKVKAMQSEMPKRYWKNMPEGEMIAPLIRAATDRTDGMIAAPAHAPARSTRVFREREAEEARVAATPIRSLADLHEAAKRCTRCPLHGPATQVVVGEGDPTAPLMFVGEQPGDQEDLAGRPFVGPAGQLFDRALAEAGIDRRKAFVTNAVKHFKFEPRGKRRIHQKPNNMEIDVCRHWLELERELVRPQLTVAMGASAGRALSGKTLTISRARGALEWPDGAAGFLTVHPSFLLRLPDEAARRAEYDRFVADLQAICTLIPAAAA